MLNLDSLEATRRLFAFYFKHCDTFVKKLPAALQQPSLLSSHLATGQSLTLEINEDIVETYNKELKELKADIKRLVPSQPFKTTLMHMTLARLLLIVAGCTGSLPLFLAVSCLQFVVAPLSLFVAFGMFVALFAPMIGSHYLVFPVLQHFTSQLPLAMQLGFTMDWRFALCFMAIDQLLCALCTFTTVFINPRPVSWKRARDSIVYGLINSKSQNIAMLALFAARGVRFDVLAFALDWTFSLSWQVADVISALWGHWAPLFYHQHRMAHLPRVYEQAHKFHHYLHDATAFDAHNYGSGFPEEFFHLVLETTVTIQFGIVPMSFSPNLIYQSWTNKVGHTRQHEDMDKKRTDINNHADHHTFHNKNFGIFGIVYDVAFGTQARKLDKYPYGQASYTQFDAIGSPAALLTTAKTTCARPDVSSLAAFPCRKSNTSSSGAESSLGMYDDTPSSNAVSVAKDEEKKFHADEKTPTVPMPSLVPSATWIHNNNNNNDDDDQSEVRRRRRVSDEGKVPGPGAGETAPMRRQKQRRYTQRRRRRVSSGSFASGLDFLVTKQLVERQIQDKIVTADCDGSVEAEAKTFRVILLKFEPQILATDESDGATCNTKELSEEKGE